MAENGRFIPPSDNRLAAAAAEGRVPRSQVFTAGWSILITCCALSLLEDVIADAFVSILRWGLDAATGRAPIFSSPWTRIWPLLILLAAPFVGTVVGHFVPLLLWPRGRGATSVPIPSPDYPRMEISVFRIMGLGVVGLFALYRFRNFQWSSILPTASHHLLFHEITRFGAVLGAAALLVGTHEIVAQRRALFTALKLNRSESNREMRAAQGGGLIRKRRAPHIEEGA